MAYHWSIHQLTEYLVSVSKPDVSGAAIVVALERAIEALDAEFGAVVIDGEVRGSLGFGSQELPAAFVAAASDHDPVALPGIGEIYVVRGELDKVDSRRGSSDARLIVGRLDEDYAAEEHQMLRGMALMLGLVLHNIETLQAERSRHQLVGTLLEIQRAISAHRPLEELLDAITAGASALLGGCPIVLLLTDPLVPGMLMQASVYGCLELDEAALTAVGEMIASNGAAADHRPAEDELMLAERVVVGGETGGCLVAQPDQSGARRRDQGELLSAFAQQVSLALTDARTLDALREAHHDSITGLPKRALFLERLEQARRTALAKGHDLTVLFIDIDRFKDVNDTLGHQAGDELLAEVGRRITACIRAEDTAARLGGDEFSILLDGAGEDAGRNLAERIIDALRRAFALSGREVLIDASVGIAVLTAEHRDAGALLGDADVAMYRAKRSGRGRWVVFEPHVHETIVNRLNLRTDLRHPRELRRPESETRRHGRSRTSG
jgi:diguanylate cyclase (GGDEF)-like protein